MISEIKSIFEQMQIMRYNCHIDSLISAVVRIEDDEKKLFDCRYCVLKDVVKMLVCPNEIREDIEKLR